MYNEDNYAAEISELAYALAENELLTVVDFSDWIVGEADAQGKKGSMLERLTNKSLFETFVLDPEKCTLAQLESACMELRARFLADNDKYIRVRAAELTDRDFRNDEDQASK